MKKIIVLVFALLLTLAFSFSAVAGDIIDTISEADALNKKGGLASYKAERKLLAPSIGKSEEATWRYSRATYNIAVRLTDMKTQEQMFEKAYTAIEPYFNNGSKNINTNFWYALCAGKYGKIKGIIKTLFLVKPMKKACKEVVKQNPGYEKGAALAILGIIEYEVPGGDKELTIKYCTRALKYEPLGVASNLYLAKTYYDKKEYKKAKEKLTTLIEKSKIKTKDDKRDLQEGKDLLIKVNEKISG